MPDAIPTVVIVGRPNVGKSSLLNRLLGEERVIVSPVAGTTRDAVDTLLKTPEKTFRLIDTAGGLLLGTAIGLGIVWVGASVALLTPGETRIRQEVERSAIVKQLDSALPPRTLLNLLARIDPFPSIVGPQAPSLPPGKGVLRDPSIDAAATRVVKVLGTACGVGIEGSGWFAGRDLIVTAAHVVAGEGGRDTSVRIPGDDRPELGAAGRDPGDPARALVRAQQEEVTQE